jgi:hypothetical protein
MPSNVGQRRPEIDATCTIGSHQLSNRAINGGFKFLDRSLGALAWNACKIAFIEERERPPPWFSSL